MRERKREKYRGMEGRRWSRGSEVEESGRKERGRKEGEGRRGEGRRGERREKK